MATQFFSTSDTPKELVYLVVKSSFHTNRKPEYQIISVFPERYPAPPYDKIHQKGYVQFPIKRKTPSLEDEVFMIELEKEWKDYEVTVIGHSVLQGEAEKLRDEVSAKFRNEAEAGGKKVKQLEWKYDAEYVLRTVELKVGDEWFWWDVVEIDILTRTGYTFPKKRWLLKKVGDRWEHYEEAEEENNTVEKEGGD